MSSWLGLIQASETLRGLELYNQGWIMSTSVYGIFIARKSFPEAEQCIPQQQEGTEQEEQERSQILQESWTR